MPRAVEPVPMRDISAEDLVRLRDIGQPDPVTPSSPLALSPDGREVAFLLNRADLESNAYCRALVIVGLAPGSVPRAVDTGGEFIMVESGRRGLIRKTGFPALIAPAWSPDGSTIAYLRRDDVVTQLWLAEADGDGARPLTRSAVDVEAFAWDESGAHLVYASRPATIQRREAQAREGDSGFLYDERFVPNAGPAPLLRSDVPASHFSVAVGSGTISPAGEKDVALLGGAGLSDRQQPQATGPSGRLASTQPIDDSLLSPSRIVNGAGDEGGEGCTDAACQGSIIGLWWTADGAELLWLRREGWARGEMALYRWRPGGAAPRRILTTADVLHGCITAPDGLLCTREGATMPRRIVLIDTVTGAGHTVLDPNPEFTRIRLGDVERMTWTNDVGIESYGDIVLPPGYGGGALPLVIVQYHSRGFLRGGTGDEYPIHLLAARGFAVMSFERPRDYATRIPGIKTVDQFEAANDRGWADRRSVLSAIEVGVAQLVERGIADPVRIGLSGLSDGATTVRFALINSRTFAAAAISTCCMDPNTVMTYGGIAWAEWLKSIGFPPLDQHAPEFWQPFSMAVSAKRVEAPLLMQLSDDEYLLALESFTALREAGKPVEMYVYPGEYHNKFQPRHRLAIYRRNLDWFDFWLRGREDPASAKTAQYARWRAMRTGRGDSGMFKSHQADQARVQASASTSWSRR